MATRVPLYLNFDTGELRPTVADDGSTTDVVPGLLPVNGVFCSTNNADPTIELGYGAWEYLGTQSVGGYDIYYYKRTS